MKSVIVLRYATMIVLLASMAGCATHNLNPKFQLTNQDAVVVLGTEGLSSVTILSGRSDGTKWHGTASLSNRPRLTDDGFIVARLNGTSGDQKYGILNADVDKQIVRLGNSLCVRIPNSKQQRLPIFSTDPGTVTYIGTLTCEYTNSVLNFVARWDPEGARRYMEKKYPNLAVRLQYRQFELQGWSYFSAPW